MKTLRRRRKEGKTDYFKRLKFLKGEKPRLVFRGTNRYVNVQYVESKEARDRVVFGVSSKDLLNYGWPKEMTGSLKSIPAAYLVGFLVGKNILNKELKQPIVDFGMARVLHKGRVYGFLKGLIDSGVKVRCKEECFPEEDRITGKHLSKDFTEIFNGIKSKVEGLK